eukprot:s1665_g13.t1
MKRRSVSSVLASAAKVARAEARLFGTPQPSRGFPNLRSDEFPKEREERPPHNSPEEPSCCIANTESESEAESMAAGPLDLREVERPHVSPKPAIWQCPRLEKLLPKTLQEDRGMMQAWDKGRRLAKTVSLQGPWPGEATVKSKSCDEPRSVDLARCCCSCPSTHAFCAHLLAATLAAEESGDVEACGRMAFLSHMHHLARGKQRRIEMAAEVSAAAVAALLPMASEAALCRWALLSLLALCQRQPPTASVMSSPGSVLCFQLAEKAEEIQTASHAAVFIDSMVQELGKSTPCASLTLAAASAAAERLLLAAAPEKTEMFCDWPF